MFSRPPNLTKGKEMKFDRYKFAMEKRIASSVDLKSFVLEVLQEEGLDPAIVNFKEEGISIQAFNKLCRALYEQGFKDGLDQYTQIVDTKKRLNREGKLLSHHAALAKEYHQTNQMNKKSRLAINN